VAEERQKIALNGRRVEHRSNMKSFAHFCKLHAAMLIKMPGEILPGKERGIEQLNPGK
jgi:hypothetical protein